MGYFNVLNESIQTGPCLCVGSEGAKNLKNRFEQMAKQGEEEARKQAERVKLSRKASEDREKNEEQQRNQVT